MGLEQRACYNMPNPPAPKSGNATNAVLNAKVNATTVGTRQSNTLNMLLLICIRICKNG